MNSGIFTSAYGGVLGMQKRRPEQQQNAWHNMLNQLMGTTTGNASTVVFDIPAATTAAPATPREGSALAWLDQRINELRVRL